MTFADKLAALCAMELAEAKRDPDRMGAMIERLCRMLGQTIVHAVDGDGRRIDELVTGAEGYIHRAAVDGAALATYMAESRHPREGGE